jgi:uncharacterized membrane protein
VDDTVLVGGREIPERFPKIVEEALKANGIDWPPVTALDLAFPDLEPQSAMRATAESAAVGDEQPEGETGAETGAASVDRTSVAPVAPSEAAAEADEPAAVTSASGLAEAAIAPPPDPVGMTLAGAVLGALVLSLAYAGWRLWPPPSLGWLQWSGPSRRLLPVIIAIGLVVAGYLSYVELTQSEAVCGPIGACNLVQSSQYAELFGIPIAVLGVVNYATLGLLWLAGSLPRTLEADWGKRTAGAFLLLALAGTIFSIYLTLLELVAIHAVCLWCLTSAVAAGSLLVISVHGLVSSASVSEASPILQ